MKTKNNKGDENSKLKEEFYIKILFFQVRFTVRYGWIYYLFLALIGLSFATMLALIWIMIMTGFSP